MSAVDTSSASTVWDELLDGLEAALGSGEPFEPPAEVPPLPERLGPRARALLERQQAREAELRAELAAVAQDLERRPRPPRRAAAPPSGNALSL